MKSAPYGKKRNLKKKERQKDVTSEVRCGLLKCDVLTDVWWGLLQCDVTY